MDCRSAMIFACFVIFVHVVEGLRTKLCHPDEQEALLIFKEALVLEDTDLLHWRAGEGEDCCKWRGITCNNITGYVIQLHLSQLHTFSESKISPALLKLRHLQHLHLTVNDPFVLPSSMRTPGFLGSLNELRYLSLSGCVVGEIPQSLGNLTKLRVLDLSSFHANAKSLGWLSGLRELNILSLDGVNLSRVGHEWIKVLGLLPSLKELYLQLCYLQDARTWTPPYFNYSSSLSVIDLSFNEEIGQSVQEWLLQSNMTSLMRFDATYAGMNGSFTPLFVKLHNLEELHLSCNFFSELPANSIASMNASLRILDLSNNLITGAIPTEVGLLKNLRELDLRNFNIPNRRFKGNPKNRLEGALPHSLCHLQKLVKLSLGYNALNGTIPECLGLLSTLQTLSLEHNRLEGALPSTLGQLSHLRVLNIGSNSLEGQVQETHFKHLSHLVELDFSSNFLKLELPSNWVPPFEDLKILFLDSCVVGPEYPPWIQMLKSLNSLSLSKTSIEGYLPHWFSESSCQYEYLDLSNNTIQGRIQNTYNRSHKSFIGILDLSHNHLHGLIPSFNDTVVDFLSLSFNQFEGSIPSNLMSGDIYSIDLSYNQLTGKIPSSIGNSTTLSNIDLSGNHLSGQLPVSMTNLGSLSSLHLADNNLSGVLPQELNNITNLMTLDLGGNKFTGRIPNWVGFENLRFLRLRSNFFSMEIPEELMNLTSLCVLDIADNYLSGAIPRSISNLSTMRTKQSEVTDLVTISLEMLNGRVRILDESLDVERNKISYKYTKTLSLVVSLNLANNNLSGEIPAELTNLIGLIMLNLSHNRFSGLIPERIGNLVNLDILDLSENRLSGGIPFSLTQIPRLSHWNLSHNNLSGNIPMSPQLQTLVDPSMYDGNNGLCGFPLQKRCEDEKANASNSKPIRHADEQNVGIYVSVVAGFVAGFWCFSVPLLFKRSIRILYFQYLDRIIGRISC